MSTDYDPSIAAQAKTAMDQLLTDRARAWVAYEGEYRAHTATKAALAAAEKRAEEAEAKLATARNDALEDVALEAEDIERHTHDKREAEFATDWAERVRGMKCDAADDAEARRDARMVGP